MAAARWVTAAGVVCLGWLGTEGRIPAEMKLHPMTATDLLAAVQEDCEVEVAGGQCDGSLSLLQLRGERRVAESQEDWADNTGTQQSEGGESDSDENVNERCGVVSEYCEDVMVYLLQKDCAARRLCRTIDMGDYFPGVVRGEAWFCATAFRKCDRKLSRLDFQPVDEVPQEYEHFGAGLIAAPSPGTCRARACGKYDRHAECQCNDKCEQYGNCCPDYKDLCKSCAHRSCFTYIKKAMCQCNEFCTKYGNCCEDYKEVCDASGNTPGQGLWSSPGIGVGGQTMTLYHTTSLEVAQIIVRTGFRPGRSGWCGGAIYFIDTPVLPRSKYAPGITEDGAILETRVEMGRLATDFDSKCKGYGGHGVSAAKSAHYHSMRFDPGDGDEYIIWNPKQVLSIRIYEEKLTGR